jgi:hypothetical protein
LNAFQSPFFFERPAFERTWVCCVPSQVFPRVLLWIMVSIIFHGCATLPLESPPPPFTRQQIHRVVSDIREQDSQVHTFSSLGRLRVQTRGSESESDVLMVGQKDPSRIKIEVTHPWGRPLVHLLIYENHVKILSLPEKRVYIGKLEDVASWEFFPRDLDLKQFWSLARGYPVLQGHKQVVSLKGYEITLLDGKLDPVQVIDFDSKTKCPRMISFPHKETNILFSDFEDDNGILYARTIRVSDLRDEAELTLDVKQVAFNGPIPEKIFELNIPPDFKVVYLNRDSGR